MKSKDIDRIDVIDPHVHSGEDVFGPDSKTVVNSDLNVYVKNAEKLRIKKIIVIPEPTHRLRLRNGIIEESCIWEVKEDNTEKQHIEFKRLLKRDDSTRTELNPKNPYININRFVLNDIKSRNKASGVPKMFFAPLLHPRLDSEPNIVEFINDDQTKAIKIHGPSTYSSPSNIPKWAINLSRKYDLPFIIHTDSIYELETASSSAMKLILEKNISSKWARWANENNVCAYLAHGIGLDKETAKIVNNNENLIVGIGPDAVINSEITGQNKDRKSTYIETLFNIVYPERVVFSTDFAWNWKSSDKNTLDWKTKKRLSKFFIENGYDFNTVFNILYNTSDQFFNMR